MKWDKKGVKYLNSLHELKLIGPRLKGGTGLKLHGGHDGHCHRAPLIGLGALKSQSMLWYA